MRPEDILLVDFETRSLANLRNVGGRNYAEHSSTEVLCATLASYSGERWEYLDLWRPAGGFPLLSPPPVAIAHNAIGFDRHIWRKLGWPEPGRWVDSAVLSRRAGYASASLGAVGERYGMPKDKEGSRLTVALSQRSRKHPSEFMRDPEALRSRVLAYCRSDVELMARIVEDLLDDFDWVDFDVDGWRAFEARVYNVDLAVRDRGIRFDQALARRLLEEDQHEAISACERAGVTPAQMRSVPQFRALASADSARRGDLAGRGDEPIVAARLACTSIVAGKLRAGLARVSPDSRLRDVTRYYGAHTGRWSGQGIQVQNLPRGGPVRGVLTASPGNMLAVCDFAGIEARVLAWLSGDDAQLQLFRDGADPYRAIAGVIFGTSPADITRDQRTIGKIAELALGYGMGVRKFEAHAGRDTLRSAGVNAHKVVTLWRARRDAVVRFWAFLRSAWLHQTAPYEPYSDGTLRLRLPSGRWLVYRDARYDSYIGRNNSRVRVYGGLLAENYVQAAARDLLAAALVAAEDEGLNPVMHVHDEIVCDVPEHRSNSVLARLLDIMSDAEAPDWAAGCPISSEGYVAFRYRK